MNHTLTVRRGGGMLSDFFHWLKCFFTGCSINSKQRVRDAKFMYGGKTRRHRRH